MPSKIKGMDKAQRRLKQMMRKYPEVARDAMHYATKLIEGKAMDNVTGGNPLFVRSGALKAAIRSMVNQTQGGVVTRGTVGIPKHVWYGRVHELGEPAVIRPKRGKYLRFQAGTRGMSPAAGRARGNWVSVKEVHVKKRPWLHPAHVTSLPKIRKRFQGITKELLRRAH